MEVGTRTTRAIFDRGMRPSIPASAPRVPATDLSDCISKDPGLPIDLVPLCSSNRGRLSPVSLSSAGLAAVVKISRYPSSTSFQ